MATLAELARHETDLGRQQLARLHRLVGEWGMLADLCFSDLLLLVPPLSGRGWLVVGQIRPTTSQTLFHDDWVGRVVATGEYPVLEASWRRGTIVDADLPSGTWGESSGVTAIPVRHDGVVVAILLRAWSPMAGRQPGVLERTYLSVFHRFAAMIADGVFPFEADRSSTAALPRVGDGALLLDASQAVEFASPNAVSALHRAGIVANVVGARLGELGFDDHAVRLAFETAAPVTEEVEQPDVILLVRCLPLVAAGSVTGGLVLVRDITDLRRRDRMLLSKDATIREIHHRVKNNLQTISSLLRLQARRLSSVEAKEAIEESVRRIGTIALVHDSLSREAADEVGIVEVVRPISRMIEESLASPDRPVRVIVRGIDATLPAAIATPLAVVVTELIQNAVDHAFGDGPVDGGAPTGHVVVDIGQDGPELLVRVVDDGVGVPEGFELAGATGLGLQIVHTLVETELRGRIHVGRALPAGSPPLVLPFGGPVGTVVEVRFPHGPA